MTNKQDPEVLILVGSPKEDGKSARLAKNLEANLKDLGAKPCVFELAKYPVAACTGCNSCAISGQCCITGDSFNVLSKHMDSADAFVVVAPIYFAGPSGWLKAALDRCQVYWARRYLLKQEMPPFRPAHLAVIGDGDDPFGYDPLVTICTSALNSTGLRLIPKRVHDFVADNYNDEAISALAGDVMRSIYENRILAKHVREGEDNA